MHVCVSTTMNMTSLDSFFNILCGDNIIVDGWRDYGG